MIHLRKVINSQFQFTIVLLFNFILFFALHAKNQNQRWQIVVSQTQLQDKAIQVAIEDLEKTGFDNNISFIVSNENVDDLDNLILVGDISRNRLISRLVSEKHITLESLENEQGYQIVTLKSAGKRNLIISGGSIIGDVYGLYWLRDRIRVFKEIPEINVTRIPAMKTRMSLAWGRSAFGGGTEDDMRRALSYSINWVAGPPILDLVPWNSEPEKTNNEKNRAKVRNLISYAHDLHIKYFSFANEFTYHPSILNEFNATLSPCDTGFWEALQAKYRRLFNVLPELDGIELCTDDISGFWENYRGFDLMHGGDKCEWPLDKRYRTFVKKIHDVVVGEFNKTYFHFTWSLVSYEQHSQADVYRKIFTDDVPVKNLYLLPKVTAHDRWWHQAYNPTFNLTPHNTLVCFETMNYYESSRSNIFPTFSGQYFQAGLQTFLAVKDNNIRGTGYLVGPAREGWDTRSAYSYVLYRLSWDPNEDIRQIAEDFCSIHFGPAVAKAMAEIYMLTPVAYKYGLHIEPVSYGQFNSFIHMRVGTFPAQGYPSIDGGKEHIDFLRRIYLRCKPWKIETLDDLDHGLNTAKQMVEKFESVKPLLKDQNLAQKVGNSLKMTYSLIQTNNIYVKTAFAYFEYRENPTTTSRDILSDYNSRLIRTISRFKSIPGFGYKLFGVNQLLRNVKVALDDLNLAEQTLDQAPTREELEKTITDQQKLYEQILARYSDEAIKFLHFDVEIDGRDILSIKGDSYKIEHLRWDSPHVRKSQFEAVLPEKAVTVIPKTIQSRPMAPFVLQQPNQENDFTTKIYLYDKPGGFGIVTFDLYYIPKSPEELGVELPW